MKKVLIVEDELSIASFLSSVIQMIGYESKILTDGKRVLATTKEWRPDLITLDIMMPSPNGIEILSQLKSQPDTELIPVFIISILANDKKLVNEFSKAQGVFEKPIDTKRFIEQVQKFCAPERS